MKHVPVSCIMAALLLAVCNVFAQTLHLMTYNIRLELKSDGINQWDNRKAVLAGQIKFYAPDILGIQEAMPSQVTYLDSSLNGYKHIGIAREGEGKGEASSIFYNSSRLQLLQHKTFWLSATPDTVSKGWDASYLRVCTYGLFKHKRSKKLFWVFNTHLDNNGVVARLRSVELILQKIKQVNTKQLPVFFMGDFNAAPGSEVITGLKKEMNDARDIAAEKPFGPSGTFNGFEFNKPVTMLIDYIFISKTPAVTVNKYAVLSDSYDLKYPSDHLPVFVELRIK